MAESMQKMMGDLQKDKPTRDQLEANVKISHNWKTAVASGTYSGHQALHIATLLDFLTSENVKAVAAFEAEYKIHPEWKKEAVPA